MGCGPFAELTAAGQVFRLRGLALAVCRLYGLEPFRISLLKHSLNTTFRLEGVRTPTVGSSQQPERYVIRIHRPGYHDVAAISSELLWLQAIRRDTGLVVPEPIASPEGQTTVTATGKDIPEARICVLFRWIDGTSPKPPLPPWLLRRTGRFLAELHTYGQQFRAVHAVSRKRWDLNGLRGAAVGVDAERASTLLEPAQRELHRRAAERLQAAMETLGDGPEVFGLIHSDLFSENLLVHRGEVRAIDFDGSGWGYFLYDLAVVLADCRHARDYPTMAANLLRGYRQLRPLSVREEHFLDAFIGGRIMVHSAWVAAHAQESALRARAASFLEQQARSLAALLDAPRPQPLGPLSE